MDPAKNSLQNTVPFLSGSKKYLDPVLASPGPGSYLLKEDVYKPNRNNFPSFGTTQARDSLFLTPQSPGPGSYEQFQSQNRPSHHSKKRKIVYSSSPSVPAKTIVYQTSYHPIKPIDSVGFKQKNFSPTKGTFPKATRLLKLESSQSGENLGPGTYNSQGVKPKGITFSKSEKKYILNHEICKESYLKSEDLTSFPVIKVPKKWQNFGNRCERIVYEIKDSFYVKNKPTSNRRGLQGSVPIKSPDFKHKKL